MPNKAAEDRNARSIRCCSKMILAWMVPRVAEAMQPAAKGG
jgi:hypothetical protein